MVTVDGLEQMARVFDRLRHRQPRSRAAEEAMQALRPLVVVTGGSEGLGLALARRFAETGANVLLVARDAAKLDRAARALAPIATVSTLPLDITVPDAASILAARVARENAYVDILVNAAGIGMAGPFAEQDEARIAALIALNMTALTALTRLVLPGMIARGRGGVLNVSSLGGYAPGPWQAAYYASKAYVTSLSEALAHETRGQGVRISALAPGPVATAFHERMGSSDALYLRLLKVHTTDAIARSAYWRFRLGQRVIVPGPFYSVVALAMRLLPHRVLLPIIGFLLRKRGT